MDDKRQNLISSRLRDGYTEDDLKLAIFGCTVSKWHQGQNDRNLIYDSIELIFRSADKIDKFMDLGQLELDKREALAVIKRQNDEARLKASVCGDTYKEHRGALLSLVKKNG